MIAIRIALAAIFALFVAGCWDDGAARSERPESSGGGSARPAATASADFDYWTLALSWSPTYCEENADPDPAQCGPRARPYAFIVHGLWPQHERGWPDFCDTSERWVPEERINAMRDIMPAKGLIIHQWKKHGTCSGLSQAEYFETTRALFELIRIPKRFRNPQDWVTTSPKAIEQSFLSANPSLSAASIAVTCGNRRDRANLRELRICFDKDFAPRACGANERRECRADTLVLPPARGR